MKKLKGNGLEDYAKETLERRKKLWEEVKRHRKEGKYAVIKFDKIFVKDMHN